MSHQVEPESGVERGVGGGNLGCAIALADGGPATSSEGTFLATATVLFPCGCLSPGGALRRPPALHPNPALSSSGAIQLPSGKAPECR